MSTATAPGRMPAGEQPSGPPYSARTAASSATIEIDDVRAGGGLGRRSRDARPEPLGERGRPVRASGCRGRPRSPARAGARPSPSPSGRCRATATVGSAVRSPPHAHRQARLTVSTIRSTDGIGEVLERRRRRQRDVRRRDAHDRRVEAVEALVGDDRHDLRAPAAQPRVLLDREQPARLLDRGEDRRGVERDERAQVDDLGVDAVLGGRRSAASRALGTIAASATIVTSEPGADDRGRARARRRSRRRALRPCRRTAPCARRRSPDPDRGSRRPSARPRRPASTARRP